MDSSAETMNRETDLELAREAMPANLKLIEGMLIEDPGNSVMRLYAAEGFYGYAYGFIELEDSERASQFYRRCYGHALQALRDTGIQANPESSSPAELEAAVGKAGGKSVPALFWAASCLGKWIDLNRDEPTGIIEISSAAIMMQRVLELDDAYYYGGAHMFFGVYYGGRAPMFGGDYELAEQHFRKAAAINQDKLLLVNLLQAEYLDRQRLDQAGFNKRLTGIVDAPDNLYPEMALINGIAKQRARYLLTLEDDWF
jgi:tetratricopeptide (TPR) repeat protein